MVDYCEECLGKDGCTSRDNPQKNCKYYADREITEEHILTYGASMRKARKSAGLSLKRLSELSGVSVSMIAYGELEERNISLQMVIYLADALGLSLDEYTGHKVSEMKGTKHDT